MYNISSFIITPLKAIFELLYSFSYSITHEYGSALLILSILTSLLIYPLDKWANKFVNYEKKIQNILNPQIIEIGYKYKGKAKNTALSRLYKRYAYSPLYSIRLSFNILIQLPLLFGAYCFLESYTVLEKVSFVFIKDLSTADGLLFGLNFLPFLMTMVNLSVAFLSPFFSKRDKIQATVISILFFIILYSSSSALLIYWTFNNIIALAKVLFLRNKLLLRSIAKKIVNRFKHNALKDFKSNSWKLLIILSSLSPASSLWLFNVEFFGIEAISKAVFTLIIISFLFIILFNIAKKFVHFDEAKICFIAFIIIYSAVLFYGSATSIFNAEKYYILLISCIFFVVFYSGCIKTLNVILSIQLFLVFFIGTIIHVYYEYNATKDISKHQIDTSIKLKQVPNIYYILCESMNSLDIANKIYGLSKQEIDEFKLYMENRGFVIPNFIYSNGSYTEQCLYFMSIMGISPSKQVGNLDLSLSSRSVISGNNNNNLLKILKYNGYHVSHLLQGGNYYSHKGDFVDFSDVAPHYDKECDPIWFLRGIIKKIEDTILYDRIYINHNKSKVIKDPLEAIRWYLNLDIDNPRFVLQRMDYTDHTLGDGSYTYKNSSHWLESKWYLNAYKKQMEAIKVETEMILSKDPNAIIIYMGDHGAWLYRAQPNDKKELDSILSYLNIDESVFWEDKFKVFAAIRIPKNIKKIEDSFSSSNIFSYIFNNIGSTDGRTLPISNNDSYFVNGKLIIRNKEFIKYK